MCNSVVLCVIVLWNRVLGTTVVFILFCFIGKVICTTHDLSQVKLFLRKSDSILIIKRCFQKEWGSKRFAAKAQIKFTDQFCSNNGLAFIWNKWHVAFYLQVPISNYLSSSNLFLTPKSTFERRIACRVKFISYACLMMAKSSSLTPQVVSAAGNVEAHKPHVHFKFYL